MESSRILIVLIGLALVSAGNNQKSSKKGLVISNWKNHMVGDFEPFKTVSWWYNYHTYKEIYLEAPVWCHLENGTIAENKTGCFPSDPEIEFVPMIWGEKGYGSHPGLVNDPDLAETDYVVLAYNEPNRPDQADMPALDAAMLYRELNDKYPDKLFVSPSCSSTTSPWMDEFMTECDKLNCKIDYLAAHMYLGTPNQRLNKLKNFSEKFGGRKIWLTEFALAKEQNMTKIVDFVETFLPMLEQADFIHKYSWFINRYKYNHDEEHDENDTFWNDSYNSLVEQEHPRLTPVGQAYDKPWHLMK